MITAHNNVRANGPFGPNVAPNPPLTPLTWNTAAAGTAASWAAGCQFAHNPGRGFYGENIYASTNSPSPANIVSLWASEAQYYNLSANTCAAGQICGHYTQLVWNTTTSVGCATQFCNVNSPFGGGNWYIAVCDYSPPGNYGGQRPYTTIATPIPGTLQFSSSAFSVNEFGGSVTISVTRSGGSSGPVSVQYTTSNGTAAAGQDYSTTSGTLTWADGDTSTKSFTVFVTDDSVFEGNETVNLSLSNPGGGALLGSPSGAVLTIIDNDTQPTVSIANTSGGAEPSTANVFTVTLSAQPASQVTVNYASANGTAVAGSDYAAVSGTLTFPANTTSLTKSITVPTLDDSLFEGTENFTVGLSSPSGATISGVNPATGSIADNDQQPTVSIVRTAAGAEPGTANVFTVTLSAQPTSQVTVLYASTNGTATAGVDYTAVGGTITFPANTTTLTQTITVPTLDDQVFEGTENFTVGLSFPSGATISGINPATGTIADNEIQPTISIANAGGGAEPSTGNLFTVTLSGRTASQVTVQYASANGSATAGTDYTPVSGTLTFPANTATLTQQISVLTLDDVAFEGPENFTVALSAPSGATIIGASATGTIADNDSQPTLSISNTTPGAEPGTANVFTVTLSGQTAFAVSVHYATGNGTATAGSDYTAKSGDLTFVANTTNLTQIISVSTLDDLVSEGVENFTITLSAASGATISGANPIAGSIADDETQPTFSINNVSKNEGNSGPTSFTFNISLSGQTAQPASVNYSTADGTATAPGDYNAVDPTQVTFNPGDALTKTITILINGDTSIEQNETFFVNLTGAVNAGISVSQGTGTIINDDSSGRTRFDYDGDGKADISVFRPSNSTWYLNRSQAGVASTQFGAAGDMLAPADFTGDGKTDIAIFRPSNGTWYVLRSEDGTFYSAGFGQNGDIPAPADYDGDGRADTAVYRPGAGTWYIQRSTAGFVATQFGVAEDKPAIGDFDGDGKADISLFRPSTGYWYRLNSSNGSFSAIKFGAAGDKIVPADYTGDGKTDIAVWRPSNGTWYVMRSEDLTFYGAGFGVSSDIPAPGDFDGDGMTDLAVYRPSQGDWFIMQSTSGFVTVHFGITEDRPTPNVYVF